MHGDSVKLAEMSAEIRENIDILLVSSMTNLPAFLALTSPRFAHTPKVMMMHENQLTQPMPDGVERDVTYCYINYLSMLSADRLLFTTRHHLNELLDALPEFLENFPDDKHYNTVDKIRDKSLVMYPGLNLSVFDGEPDSREKNKKPVIVWNQRWQFDRNPSTFFKVLNRLNDIDLEFDLILAEGPAMLTVGKFLGQVLSPRGKMPVIMPPNPVAVKNLIEAQYSKIKVSNKKNKSSVSILTRIGKKSQDVSHISENTLVVYNSLLERLPNGKQNFKDVIFKTTMSAPVKVGGAL